MNELTEIRPDIEQANQAAMRLNLLSSVSITKILFAFIVIIPFFSGDLYIALFSFAISLRLFFTFPGRFINKLNMRPVGNRYPKLAESINIISGKIGIKSLPVVLFSEQPEISFEVFGTFRHHYLVIHKQYLDCFEKETVDLRFKEEFNFRLVHELTHIKNGDNWRVKLAEYISRIYLITYIYITLVSSISSPVVRLGSVYEQLGFLGVPLLALMEISVMQMFLLIMLHAREFSADTAAKNLYPSTGMGVLMGQEKQGSSSTTLTWLHTILFSITNMLPSLIRIFRTSWLILKRIWNPTMPPQLSENFANFRIENLGSITKEQNPANPIYRWLFQNVEKFFSFASGVMVGSLAANPTIPSFQRLILLSIFGGSVVSVIYLLATVTKGTRKFSRLLIQTLITVFSFEIGILAYMVSWAGIATILFLPIGPTVLLDADYQSGIGGMIALITIVSLILALSLGLTLPILHWCITGIELGSLKNAWYVVILISAQVFSLATIVFAAFLQQNMEQSILALRNQLVILALLLAGYNIIIRWLTSPSYSRGAK